MAAHALRRGPPWHVAGKVPRGTRVASRARPGAIAGVVAAIHKKIKVFSEIEKSTKIRGPKLEIHDVSYITGARGGPLSRSYGRKVIETH